MSVTAQDVQNVIDVSGILANNEVAVKPDLVAALIDWKGGVEQTPPAPVSVKSNVADKVSKAKVETVSTPDPTVDDPGF